MSEMLVYSHTTQYKSLIASINKIFAFGGKLEMQPVFLLFVFANKDSWDCCQDYSVTFSTL